MNDVGRDLARKKLRGVTFLWVCIELDCFTTDGCFTTDLDLYNSKSLILKGFIL